MHGNYKENKETVSKHKIKSDNQRGIGYKAFAILAKYIINENMSVILVFTSRNYITSELTNIL